MKKVIKKALSFAILFGLISNVAMAGDPIKINNNNGTITIEVSGLNNGEETTLLVTKNSATISEAFSDTTKIYHIDQVAANDSGVSTFKFTYSGEDPLTVYSGYATMSATDKPYSEVIDENSSSQPGEGTDYILGDVNGDTAVNASDITSIVQYILNGTEFTKTDGITVYEQGKDAADVNFDSAVNASDITKIVSYILNGTPFEQ